MDRKRCDGSIASGSGRTGDIQALFPGQGEGDGPEDVNDWGNTGSGYEVKGEVTNAESANGSSRVESGMWPWTSKREGEGG